MIMWRRTIPGAQEELDKFEGELCILNQVNMDMVGCGERRD